MNKQITTLALLISSLAPMVDAQMLEVKSAVSGERLTPPVSLKPSINGAKVYGVHPKSDIIFRVPVSGERPLSIQAKGLPAGVTLDPVTGILTGKIAKPGAYKVALKATNKHGAAQSFLTIKVGDTIVLTPPMGWNSWYALSESVSQEAILKVAKNMEESGLANHGWSYVNIDDCWQGVRGGPMKAMQPNVRFPDMKKMCDEVHQRGFKIGIYSGPWISTYAGFGGGSCPNEDGSYESVALPLDQRSQPTQFFGSWPGLDKMKVSHIGKYWFFDKDAKQWAEWGFDYIKVDWKPNDVPTTERIFKDLAASGRSIALSLSNAAPYENMEGLSKYANVTRTTGDIHDSWGSVSGIGFAQEPWQKYSRPGCWCDPDMLQVGKLGKTNQKNAGFSPTRLTPDEQYSQVSLWSLLSAPLLLSCDLGDLDDFTLGLLTNDDIIAVNQDEAANPAKRIFDKDGVQIWQKELKNGAVAVGFFNLKNDATTLKASGEILGLKGAYSVRNLWTRTTLGTTTDGVNISLNPHGAAMLLFYRSR